MKRTPWIMTGENGDVTCFRCGETVQAPKLPAPVSTMSAFWSGCLVAHEKCPLPTRVLLDEVKSEIMGKLNLTASEYDKVLALK